VNVAGFGAFVELMSCCDEKKAKIVGLAPNAINGHDRIQTLFNGQNIEVIVVKVDDSKGHYTLKIVS